MTQTTGVEAATTAGKLRRGPIIAGTYHRSAGSVLERLRDPASARATGIRAVVGLMVPGQQCLEMILTAEVGVAITLGDLNVKICGKHKAFN